MPRNVLVLVACLTTLAALAPGVAAAGCSTDLDCKGDRICENGSCTGELDSWDRGEALERSLKLHRQSRNRQVWGWIFLGGGALASSGGIGVGAALPEPSGAVGLTAWGAVFLTVGGLVAQNGGPRARRALRLLKVHPEGHGRYRAAGWTLWAAGLFTSFAQVGAYVGWLTSSNDVGLKVAALATSGVAMGLGLAAIVVFQLDAMRHRTQLTEVLDAMDGVGLTEATPARRIRPRLIASPWATRDGGGVAVGLVF